MEMTLQQRFGWRVTAWVVLPAATALACGRPVPQAVTNDSSSAPAASQRTTPETLERTPIVTDSSVSFVVPIRECTATTARDSAARVQAGARLFQTKGCKRCHSLTEGYADGPDLEGVTTRRSCEWVVALLTDTENMIQTDPDLQQLRIEHFLDMPDHNLSVLDARALYAYLRVAIPPGTRK
jgi:cytochrome c2